MNKIDSENLILAVTLIVALVACLVAGNSCVSMRNQMSEVEINARLALCAMNPDSQECVCGWVDQW